jgi:tetratricopeptide (TPR) repeat protein
MKMLLVTLSLLTFALLQGCAETASRVESVFDVKKARTEDLRKWVRPEKVQDQPRPDKARNHLVVFVHGFNSSIEAAWADFPALVKEDQEFAPFNILLFGYPTKVCGQVADIWRSGELLASYLKSIAPDYDSLILVGHSMGGLVILNGLATLQQDAPALFEQVSFKVLTFGTPFAGVPGSDLLLLLCENKQVEGMEALNDTLSRLHRSWQQRFGEGTGRGKESRLVPVYAHFGHEDYFVPRGSACAGFEKYCEGVDGNHATMVKPAGNRDLLAYRKVRYHAKFLKPPRPSTMPVVEGKVRVAVLPFENLTDEQHLRDGMVVSLTDSFLNSSNIIAYNERARLNRLVSERGIDNRSGYGESDVLGIGESVGADFVIWGTIQKYQRERYRATVRLVEMKGKKILKPPVEEASDSVVDLQKAIYGRLVTVLDNGISNDRFQRGLDVLAATRSLKAYEFYVKGQNSFILTTPEGYEDAIKWYGEAIRIDSKYSLAWAGMASAYVYWGYERSWNGQSYQEYYDKALEAAQKSVALDPDLSETHRALAMVYAYWLPPKREQAEAEAQRALSINPNDYEAHFAIAKARDGDEKHLLKAIEINPDYILAYNWLSTRIYNKPERMDEAINASKKILALNPKHATTYANLASFYLEKSMLGSAIESGEQAVKLKPDLQFAYLVLGVAYFQERSYPKAQAALLRALKLKEKDATAHFMLARVHEATGQTVAAIDQWEKYLALGAYSREDETYARERLKVLRSK